ncbi:hypothetical protein LTR82_017741 [Friedmanniomyces endolithicus]|uniref:Uncharacterized protein n=1 Tax=Friedmanniomyces endolithicus TaxID=329885 RepID=A0AAN6J415_9PEZI|nr:hypothetical protein LTR82_017741 [Friedmanniomyces endolithicus]
MATAHTAPHIAGPPPAGDLGGPQISADQRLLDWSGTEHLRRNLNKSLEETGDADPKTKHYQGPTYAIPAVVADKFDLDDQFYKGLESDDDEELEDTEAAQQKERKMQGEEAADMERRAQMEEEAHKRALAPLPRLDVPAEIAKIHEANTQANSEIAIINSSADPRRDAGKFSFPGEGIMHQICIVHDACASWHKVQDSSPLAQENRNSFAKVIANSILTLKNTIEPLGLSWRTFVTPEAATSLTDVLKGSMESIDRDNRRALQTYLMGDAIVATQGQESLMQQMAPVLAEQISLSGKDELAQVRGAAEEYNNQMAKLNASLGFKASDHALDLDMIQAIITFGSDVQTKHAKIMEFACWLYRTGQKSIALALCDQNDLEKAQPSDALVKKIKATQRKYQYPVDKSMESALVEHMQRRLEMQERLMTESMAKRPINQPPQHADDMEMDDQPQRLESHRRLLIDSKAKSPTYQRSQRADDTAMKDADPSSFGQDLGSTKGRSTVHDPMPGGLRRSSVKAAAFHDRVTPLGMVYSVQKWSFGYRVILNTCTEEFPVYQSIPGSELGRGSAQDLYANYPAPPSTVKDRRKKHVLELKAIIEIPQKASVGRAPTTKFLVVWNNEEKKFNSSQAEEWVSRSDLTSIYGKTDTERARKCLLDDLEFNLSHMNAMQEQGRHPETGRVLNENDWTNTPWLCHPSGNLKSAGAQTASSDRGRRGFGPGKLRMKFEDGYALDPKQGAGRDRSLTTGVWGVPFEESRGQRGFSQKRFGRDTRGAADSSREGGGVSYPSISSPMQMDNDIYDD